VLPTRSAKALVTTAVASAVAAAIVVGLAACSTPAARVTAPAPKAPRVTASVPATPNATRPTYCSPLAELAARVNPEFTAGGGSTADQDQAQYVALLRQVAKSAAADGRKDVATLFTTLAASLLTPPPTTEQINQVAALSESALNTEDADCGMTEMPWGE